MDERSTIINLLLYMVALVAEHPRSPFAAAQLLPEQAMETFTTDINKTFHATQFVMLYERRHTKGRTKNSA